MPGDPGLSGNSDFRSLVASLKPPKPEAAPSIRDDPNFRSLVGSLGGAARQASYIPEPVETALHYVGETPRALGVGIEQASKVLTIPQDFLAETIRIAQEQSKGKTPVNWTTESAPALAARHMLRRWNDPRPSLSGEALTKAGMDPSSRLFHVLAMAGDAALTLGISTPSVLGEAAKGVEVLAPEESALARGAGRVSSFLGPAVGREAFKAPLPQGSEQALSDLRQALAETKVSREPLKLPQVEGKAGPSLTELASQAVRKAPGEVEPSLLDLAASSVRTPGEAPIRISKGLLSEGRLQEQASKIEQAGAEPAPVEGVEQRAIESPEPRILPATYASPQGTAKAAEGERQGILARSETWFKGWSEALLGADKTSARVLVRASGEAHAADLEALSTLQDQMAPINAGAAGHGADPVLIRRLAFYAANGIEPPAKVFKDVPVGALEAARAASRSPEALQYLEWRKGLMAGLLEREKAVYGEFGEVPDYVYLQWKDRPEEVKQALRAWKPRITVGASPGFTKERTMGLAEGIELGLTPRDDLFEADLRRWMASNHFLSRRAAASALKGLGSEYVQEALGADGRPTKAALDLMRQGWKTWEDDSVMRKYVVSSRLAPYFDEMGVGLANQNRLLEGWGKAASVLKSVNFFFDTPHAFNVGINSFLGGGFTAFAFPSEIGEIASQGPDWMRAVRAGVMGGRTMNYSKQAMEITEDALGDQAPALRRAWRAFAHSTKAIMWDYIDKPLRLRLFRKGLAAGLSDADAGAFAAHFVGDYSRMSPELQAVSRYLLFTGRWKWLNWNIQLGELIHAPQKLAAMLKIYDAANLAVSGMASREKATQTAVRTPFKVGHPKPGFSQLTLSLGMTNPMFEPLRATENPAGYIKSGFIPMLQFVVPDPQTATLMSHAMGDKGFLKTVANTLLWRSEDVERWVLEHQESAPPWVIIADFALRAAGLHPYLTDTGRMTRAAFYGAKAALRAPGWQSRSERSGLRRDLTPDEIHAIVELGVQTAKQKARMTAYRARLQRNVQGEGQ